jgi:hypothetical protein
MTAAGEKRRHGGALRSRNPGAAQSRRRSLAIWRSNDAIASALSLRASRQFFSMSLCRIIRTFAKQKAEANRKHFGSATGSAGNPEAVCFSENIAIINRPRFRSKKFRADAKRTGTLPR